MSGRKWIAVLVGVLFLGTLVQCTAKDTDGSSDKQAGSLAKSAAFQSATVKRFRWIAEAGVSEFQRSSPADTWKPAIEAQKLQSRLDLLARLHGEMIPELSAAMVQVEIEFFDGQVWQGQWDQRSFFWTKGAKKGSGFYTKGATSKLFEEAIK
jgi:hypothetical protein